VTCAVVSLGSNLGDRLANLRLGVQTLSTLAEVHCSPVYQTQPLAAPGTPAYLNAVCLIPAVPGPMAVREAAAEAERRAGRGRGRRFAARTLDVDVVAVDDLVSEWTPFLIPHPRAHLRAFVLRPWLDLDPRAHLARRGPVADLLEGLAAQRVDRVAGPEAISR
jgi:2-amino-4-hydroxy-6-hydroxymethyldihydropteridine diphosphokinase